MFAVAVQKDKLLETIQLNRDKHVEEYALQIEGFKRLLAVYYQWALDELKAERTPKHLYPVDLETGGSLREPESHVQDYDDAIAMLGWNIGETVDLDRDTFAQYIHDDWSWKRGFAVSSAMYS